MLDTFMSNPYSQASLCHGCTSFSDIFVGITNKLVPLKILFRSKAIFLTNITAYIVY
jgi:hypothetical protein